MLCLDNGSSVINLESYFFQIVNFQEKNFYLIKEGIMLPRIIIIMVIIILVIIGNLDYLKDYTCCSISLFASTF